VWRSLAKRRGSGLLVFGLGNPGRRYAETFHNAGRMAVELLAGGLGLRFRSCGQADCASGVLEGTAVLLGRPRTYMNSSGLAVAPVYRRRAGSPEDLVVLHDDLDLPLGLVRLKRGGGTGGHNGLRSLAEELGTAGFLRVRIGIGRPPEGMDPADYVLSRVPPDARERFDRGVASAAEAVGDIARTGFDRAMTRRNAVRAQPPP
jgi:peptidyl-tRNA hydrolase, PTH1 family